MSDAAAIHEAQHYPLVMRHPNYQPAVLGAGDQVGKPAKFPQITVEDGRQEEYWRAQGYAPAGKSDPVAYHAAIKPQDLPTPVFSEYPKWIDGLGKEVRNEAEEAAALAEVERREAEAALAALEKRKREAEERAVAPEAIRNRVEAAEAGLRRAEDLLAALAITMPPSAFTAAVRSIFEDRAEAAGLKLDKRWSLETLLERLAEAK